MSPLYLIRHGKTAANEAHLYCGSSDVPLSAKGEAELRKLHYALSKDVRFVTSGMRRTEQTLFCSSATSPTKSIPPSGKSILDVSSSIPTRS